MSDRRKPSLSGERGSGLGLDGIDLDLVAAEPDPLELLEADEVPTADRVADGARRSARGAEVSYAAAATGPAATGGAHIDRADGAHQDSGEDDPASRRSIHSPSPSRRHHGRRLLGLVTLAASLLVIGGVVTVVVLARRNGAGRPDAAGSQPPVRPAELADTGPTVHILADRPAAYYLDGRPLSGPTFRLAKTDSSEHTIRAEAGCMAAEALVRGPSPPEKVHLRLSPEQTRIPVRTSPPGARVILNGHAASGLTPLALEIDRCRENRIEISLQGHNTLEYTLEAGAATAPLAAALASVTLHQPEKGRLLVAPGPYEAKVYIDGKHAGRAGQAVSLPAGPHRAEIINDALFVHLKRQLEVRAAETATWKPDWPRLGTLTVLATPTNCKVEVRPAGRSSYVYVDEVPVLKHKLAAGPYRIRCTLLSRGESQERDVRVSAGAEQRVAFTFSP